MSATPKPKQFISNRRQKQFWQFISNRRQKQFWQFISNRRSFEMRKKCKECLLRELEKGQDLTFSDQPLLSDCECGYEICFHCWNNLVTSFTKLGMVGHCPACEEQFARDRFVKRIPRPMPKKNAWNDVSVTGLPLTLAKGAALMSYEYFGLYGKVTKISIPRTKGGAVAVLLCKYHLCWQHSGMRMIIAPAMRFLLRSWMLMWSRMGITVANMMMGTDYRQVANSESGKCIKLIKTSYGLHLSKTNKPKARNNSSKQSSDIFLRRSPLLHSTPLPTLCTNIVK
ncbi:RING-type E3 ubiquitin transferase [Salvia divinorum]|uniref:RING-type E3 ubiquitin transferase n=1 Tax=Salvia divinorum TaxID=28513 RepID=A0ABD1H7F0_SALDI